ncbi:NAD(P)H-binding protein [Microlunatus soli]|uniref:Uncharacterized conserved protein YbjT, contains NAD(P)-binding and DUF2867 domains n=1 Tax=Microlunatus soli TaxID=630515 RepID=A0A1H1S2C9_9ACTN|nr:NAD(P)H-binding protein [Microlunatus soli]SDS42142.1 Uncharacterized conserved protein YbjT, contains NAD(P)-binding and DUF2867 domains [Microlunatus soli]
MTILITGARGAIARALLDQLLAADLPHRIASRTALESGVVVDFARPETLRPALDGVDKVFVYAADGLQNLVQAAEQAGVERFVLVSSLSTALPDADSNPIAAHHLAAEQTLSASTIPATFLRPGAFAGNSSWWADSIRSEGVARIPYPEARLDSIHEADIADVAFAALTEDGHQGKAYPLTGPEYLTQREQVGLIGEAIGRELAVEELDRSTAEQYLPAPVLDMFAASQQGPLETWPSSVDITGRPSRSFAQWAIDHADDYR